MFEGIGNGQVLVAVVLLALAWMLQMFLAGRQVKRFMRSIRELRTAVRGDVDVATGRARRTWGTHVFIALACDSDDVVVAARRLGGASVFSTATPWDGATGHHLDEVAAWDDTPEGRAAAQAARFLLGTEDATGRANLASDDDSNAQSSISTSPRAQDEHSESLPPARSTGHIPSRRKPNPA